MKSAIFFLGFLFVLLPARPAQGDGREVKVKYREKGTRKEASLSGTIEEESIAGIVVRTSAGKKTISGIDIEDVDFTDVPATLIPTYRNARIFEEKKTYPEAIDRYKKFLAEATVESLKSHAEFKIAFLTAELAKTDPKRVQPAIELLQKFMANHQSSWQLIHLSKLLVSLQLENKDLDGAQKTLDAMRALPKLPDDLRRECGHMAVKILRDARRYDDAEKKLQELIGELPAGDAQALPLHLSYAKVLEANNKISAAKKEFQLVVDRATRPEDKASALNALGECCRKIGETKEAMWQFLAVDVLYPQNKAEHARALYNLYKVFKELKDEPKAHDVRERLLKEDKSVADKYQKLLMKEK